MQEIAFLKRLNCLIKASLALGHIKVEKKIYEENQKR